MTTEQLTPELATIALTNLSTGELVAIANRLAPNNYAREILNREIAFRATIPAPRKR